MFCKSRKLSVQRTVHCVINYSGLCWVGLGATAGCHLLSGKRLGVALNMRSKFNPTVTPSSHLQAIWGAGSEFILEQRGYRISAWYHNRLWQFGSNRPDHCRKLHDVHQKVHIFDYHGIKGGKIILYVSKPKDLIIFYVVI